MATKKKTKAPAVVSVKLPGDIVFECSAPGVDAWDRFLEKIRRDQLSIGRREIVQTNCVSHTPEQAAKILDRWPAIASSLADALDGVCGGECKPETDPLEGTVTVELNGGVLEFSGPDMSTWEGVQADTRDKKKRYGPVMRAYLLKLANDKTAAAAAFDAFPACVGPILAATGNVAGADFTVEVKKG